MNTLLVRKDPKLSAKFEAKHGIGSLELFEKSLMESGRLAEAGRAIKITRAYAGQILKKLYEPVSLAMIKAVRRRRILYTKYGEDNLKCCERESRSMNGGCRNCGDPSY